MATGVGYCAPHALAAALGGVGAAVTVLAVQVGLWARGAARKLALL